MEYIFAKFYEKVPFVHDTINERANPPAMLGRIV